MLSDNSEYEGGEFQIKVGEKNEVLETKKGRAWFMPSYILHRVTPITKGVRKTAVVWAGGDQWK
jgi:PKHD-type hydroxylase